MVQEDLLFAAHVKLGSLKLQALINDATSAEIHPNVAKVALGLRTRSEVSKSMTIERRLDAPIC